MRPPEESPVQPGVTFDPSCVPMSVLSLIAPGPGAVLDNGCSLAPDPMVWDFAGSDVPLAERYHLFVMGSNATIRHRHRAARHRLLVTMPCRVAQTAVAGRARPHET